MVGAVRQGLEPGWSPPAVVEAGTRAAGLWALAVAGVTLVGWLSGHVVLASGVPGWATLKANTAVAFAALGMSLLRAGRPGSGAIALVAMGIAGITAAEWVLGVELGVDQLLVADHETTGGVPPGRMAMATALGLLTAGAAIWTAPLRPRTSQVFAASTLAIAWIALVGFACELGPLAGIWMYGTVSLPTAISLAGVAAGALGLTARQGWMAALTGDDGGARLLRRLLPAVLVVPALTVAVARRVEVSGTQPGFPWAVSTTLVTGVFVGLLARTAASTRVAEDARNRVQGQLRHARDLLQAVVNEAPIALFGVDSRGDVTVAGGRAWADLGPEPVDGLARAAGMDRALATALDGREAWWSGEIAGRVVEARILPQRVGGLVAGATGVATDVTEARRADALRLRRRVEAQEAERASVARELHDEIGQSLVALGMLLRRDSAPGADACALLAGLTATVRRMALDLRPSILDDLGLSPALAWLVARWSADTGIAADLHEDGEPRRYPPDTGIAAFRIVQESLTNVARHAGATRVRVDLRHGPTVEVRVDDDGVGFDATAGERYDSMGLRSMRERAEILGGTLHVASAPGRTRVTARLPDGTP